MGTTIPVKIVGLRGQVVNRVTVEASGVMCVHCRRDARYRPADTRTGGRGRANRWLRRRVWDVPLSGHRVGLDIEYLEIAIGARDRRVEALDFVEPGARYTHRLSALVSGLCRHMGISAVASWTGLAWRTVKAMDREHLQATAAGLASPRHHRCSCAGRG